MTRRRISRLGRIAMQTLYHALQDEAGSTPLVFASRHGDVNRSSELLRERAETGSVSPASFSVSVHNAIGGLFSIVRNDTAPLSAIAADVETTEMAMIEACGLLAEGAQAVLVTVYDDDSCKPYTQFDDEPRVAHAWTARLTRSGNSVFELDCATSKNSNEPGSRQLPRSLDALQFMLSGEQQRTYVAGARSWVWSRRG